jgi:hypothetical protein
VSVEVLGPDRGGIVEMVGSLISQNLERDPSRQRFLRPSVASIRATDAEATVTIRLGPGRVEVSAEPLDRPQIRIEGTSIRLLELIGVPLRYGFPDVLTPDGRAAARDVVSGRIRIRGMLAHPVRLARLTKLVSAR